MIPARDRLPGHVRLLLDSLVDASRCASLGDDQWDMLIRAARAARLLGVLAARIGRRAPLDALPEPIGRHLVAASKLARFRRSKVELLVETVGRQLSQLDPPLVLLKGGAYIAQGMRVAEGRLPADVDLMVRRASLDEAERTLLAAGWEFQKTDPYDQHYYRAWSHELPPMRCVGQAMELDLHHTILPPLGRLKPDAEALFASAMPIAGTRFAVLCPPDQVLHAAAHLFQDSDCLGRLRDLVDFEGLVREHSAADPPGFWPTLLERARLHDLCRPLWYALSFAQAWLDLPVPSEAAASINDMRPGRFSGRTVCRLAARVLPPPDPDGELSRLDRAAASLLDWRSVWLRMPPGLVAYHAGMKLVRSFRRPARPATDVP